MTIAQEDDAGFRRPIALVPAPRVGATGKRGRKRYGKGGTPHVYPNSTPRASSTLRARKFRTRRALRAHPKFRNGSWLEKAEPRWAA